MLTAFLALFTAAQPPTVRTSKGVLTGVAAGSNVSIFYSIPYAKPPTDERRFQPPQEHEAWNGTLDVSALPKHFECPQTLLHSGLPIFKGSEEHCLTLNVFKPASAKPGDKLTVMVWIPGGAFIEGSLTGGGEYNGSHFAQYGNVIVVAMQYRLGSLGFLYSPEHASVPGNLGLMDQRLALQWVQREIEAFGGDSSKVTLFGESAGGISICAHITSFASKGLFRAAIMESPVCGSAAFFNRADAADAISKDFIDHVGCGKAGGAKAILACLQALPVDKACAPLLFPSSARHAAPYTLPSLAPVIGWTPTLDGSPEGVERMPIDAIKAQQPPTVPLIIGTNQDEASLFIPLLPVIIPGVHLPMHDDDLRKVVVHFFNESASDAILARYNHTRGIKAEEAITRDYFWTCAARRLVKAASAHTYAYTYYFDYPIKFVGDCHGCELPFVWDWQSGPRGSFSPAQAALSHDIVSYWLAFTKSGGDPNGPGAPPLHWPRFDAEPQQQAVLELNATRRVLTGGFQTELCEFWAPYQLGEAG